MVLDLFGSVCSVRWQKGALVSTRGGGRCRRQVGVSEEGEYERKRGGS